MPSFWVFLSRMPRELELRFGHKKNTRPCGQLPKHSPEYVIPGPYTWGHMNSDTYPNPYSMMRIRIAGDGSK